MANKYYRLALHLNKQEKDMLQMTFQEVEDVIFGKLPPSAWKYRAWWSNNGNNTAARHGWLKAGWETARVDMEKQELLFIRKVELLLEPERRMYGSRSTIRQMDYSNSDSLDPHLVALLQDVGGIENLEKIVQAIDRYITGEIVETELGRIMRQLWTKR